MNKSAYRFLADLIHQAIFTHLFDNCRVEILTLTQKLKEVCEQAMQQLRKELSQFAQ